MGFLSFIIIFGALVSLHELGHFATARLFKVKVLEFGIGIPPRVWGFKRGETQYSLNALPIGGFVKMLGEEDPSDPRSLAAKPAWQRAAVIGAGAFMNALLAVVLFVIVFMVPQDTRVGDVTILGVAPGSPAALAGIREGDVIREVNGRSVENFRDLHFQYQLRRGATATTVVERGGELLPYDVIPRWKVPAGEGLTGIRVDLFNDRTVSRSEPFWDAVPKAGERIADSVVLMKNGISSWFVGASDPLDEVSGPVGIVQVTGEDGSFSALQSAADGVVVLRVDDQHTVRRNRLLEATPVVCFEGKIACNKKLSICHKLPKGYASKGRSAQRHFIPVL